MLSRLSRSHLWLGSSLEFAFIHLALEVRGTLCSVVLSIFQRRKAPLGCYQQTFAQLLELPMWLTPAPSFSLEASVERAYEDHPHWMVQGYVVAGLYFEQCWRFVFWGVQSKQLICHLEKSGCNLKKEQIVTLGKKEWPTREGNLSW